MKNKYLKSMFIYMLPLVIVFTIVLLAFWPGIMSPDAMVQWNQVQTGNIDNWHPAYVTLLMSLLAKIWNSPTLIIIIQYLVIASIFAYTLTRLEKYYQIERKYLVIVAILFALFPLNFNFAVNMLKDTLYAFLLLLLIAFTLDIINDEKWLKKYQNIIKFSLTGLAICLFRHNGILVMGMYALIYLIIFPKNKTNILICGTWIIGYFLLTTIGFKVLNIKENNYANKFGPISHIMAKMLNDNIPLSKKELQTLDKYVDTKTLKTTYNQYNMDYSINCQKNEYIKDHQKEYLLFGLKEFRKYPMEVIKYYLNTTSFFYSPIPFNNSFYAGMFTETELYIYEKDYPNLKEDSKIPWLNQKLKTITKKINYGKIGNIVMRPFYYTLFSLISVVFLCYRYHNKKLFLIIIPSLLNIFSLIPAMPVASTRYIYISILTCWLVVFWALFSIIKTKKD